MGVEKLVCANGVCKINGLDASITEVLVESLHITLTLVVACLQFED